MRLVCAPFGRRYAETNIVGYDVCVFLKQKGTGYLRVNGHEDESLVEMLLTRGPTYEYKIGYSFHDEKYWETKTGNFRWVDHVALAVVCRVRALAYLPSINMPMFFIILHVNFES